MLTHETFASRFQRPLFGMVHLAALPSAPAFGGSIDAVSDAALADARALRDGGCDGMVFENFGDGPFFKERVEAARYAVRAEKHYAKWVQEQKRLGEGG